MLKVVGKKTLVFGDIHADDKFQGRHFNYWENFMETTDRILAVVKEEKPDLVILLGDLVGVRRGVATLTHRTTLLYLAKFLQALCEEVVILKGNHDYQESSDYEFLADMGVFKSSKQVNNIIEFTYPNIDKPTYLHCVDYGQEHEKVDIQEDAYNILLGHNEFYVTGKEQQYHTQMAIELSSKTNFFGADLVLSGHIHTPTQGMVDFVFHNGHDSGFINVGCPTRPSAGEIYDSVWYIALEYEQIENSDSYSLGFRQEVLNLKPHTEVFRPKEDFLEENEADIDEYTGIQKGKLEEILGNLVTSNMGSEDFFEQVDSIMLAPPEARDMAKKYLSKALNM